MKAFIKWSGVVLAVVLLLGFIGFSVWSMQTYTPTAALKSEVALPKIVVDEDVIIEPENPNGTGIVIYPGARVKNTAYSYYAQGLAREGYTVIVPKMPFNIAFFNSGRAEMYVERFPKVHEWFIGGHSLGGVAASMYADKHTVRGLILLASYPAKTNDLSKKGFDVLSVFAENDQLTTRDKINAAKPLLPSDTTYFQIDGGNHAQFGMYGQQKGDGQATISALEQQDTLIATTLRWLKQH
jgi:dienelactone hydrolase